MIQSEIETWFGDIKKLIDTFAGKDNPLASAQQTEELKKNITQKQNELDKQMREMAEQLHKIQANGDTYINTVD
jgi:hypothetical protein